MNLIANACQAINGKGDIWITTRLETAKDLRGMGNFPHIVIRIRDNGTGIDSDVIDKIFDPFFTTKDVGQGAGLGLSVSYGIIQRHKAQISVNSQVGGAETGTTFTIRIPVDFEMNS